MGLSATVLTRRFPSVGRAVTYVTLGTFTIYFAWTALLVEWRIQLRARLNALDSAKGAYFVDSLAGQEAIKLYGNEAAEEQRFDGILGASPPPRSAPPLSARCSTPARRDLSLAG